MDISNLMNVVLSSGSLDSISKSAGISTDQAASVVQSIMPMLLQGASAQANGKDTADSFSKAIEDHSGKDTRDLGKFFGGVDLADGAKIVQHLLGKKTASSVTAAAKESGVSEANVKKILTMVAPLLLAILGQQKKKHGLSSLLLQAVMAGTVGKAAKGANVLDLLGKLVK